MRFMVLLLALSCAITFAADNAAIAPQSSTSHKPQATFYGAEAVTIPQMLSYQGKLTDTLGQPVTDTLYAVRFRLFAQPTGGTHFWEENQQVRTQDGLFSTLLGSVTPIGSVPAAGALYLGMAVAGGVEMTPRVRIVSAAYAYKADTAGVAIIGADNLWVRGGDSVMQTVHTLAIARGGAGNVLHGPKRYSHVNLGHSSTTGDSGVDYFGCVVLGGANNTAGGSYTTIGGGFQNTATARGATVPGGQLNTAAGQYSFAAGRNARSNADGCFTWSDTTNTSFTNSTANRWRVRASGGVYFYTNASLSTGSYLAPGSNSWESACDSMTKEDFRPVDRKSLLDKVAALRVRDFKMKDQNDGTRHIGPVAQDFQSAFGYGGNETSINMADADGVLLAAVQALYEQNQNQQAEIEALKAELRRR